MGERRDGGGDAIGGGGAKQVDANDRRLARGACGGAQASRCAARVAVGGGDGGGGKVSGMGIERGGLPRECAPGACGGGVSAPRAFEGRRLQREACTFFPRVGHGGERGEIERALEPVARGRDLTSVEVQIVLEAELLEFWKRRELSDERLVPFARPAVR